MVDDKLFLSADDLLADAFALAQIVLESGFEPTHLVGVWRGGAPVAVAVEEAFRYHGIKADNIAVRTRAYSSIDKLRREVSVHGLEYLADCLTPQNRLLIVDDVFDRGHSLETLIGRLREVCGPAMPGEVKTACVWYKPARRETELAPDYYVHETARWLVFPHELEGLTPDEIAQHKRVPAGFADAAGRPRTARK